MQCVDINSQGFEAVLMRAIEVTSASTNAIGDGTEASASFEMIVAPELCNPMDRMHGGAMATLADMATTMATAYVSHVNQIMQR